MLPRPSPTPSPTATAAGVRSTDLLVIGAGSAGAAIAARVTERTDREVLLLEAGPDYPDLARLPQDLRDGTRNSWRQHDWGYTFDPTPGQRRLYFPRGKVVGGSSAVNTCIALRPLPYDLDEWAARGLPEWSFEACLPYLKRLEDDLDFADAPWHGRGGPIPIRRHKPEELVPWQAAFVEAARRHGFPACEDTNDPSTEGGVGPHAMNKINGVRMSAARGYLTPEVRRRPNLRVVANALVRRVLVKGGRAQGVEVEVGGRVEVVTAREVVLSAGAIATPGILLRSGIGPRAEVARLGVELVADVPAVGARLLDHPGSVIVLWPRWGAASTAHPLIQTVLRYTAKGSPYPNDMQLQPGSFFPVTPRITTPAVAIACCVGKPGGHGLIRFPSADPRAMPVIQGRLLMHPDNHARVVEGMQLAYELLRAGGPLREIARPLWPDERTLASRDALAAWIPRASGSGLHPCGTVPMGPEGAPDAAVDGRGRVRGVAGLVVADASLMPTVPSANTNLTALMIGERFGEWLREGPLE